MRKTETITTYQCDICQKPCKEPETVIHVTTGYAPVEAGGVRFLVSTFGIPANEMVVCDACVLDAMKKHIAAHAPKEPHP